MSVVAARRAVWLWLEGVAFLALSVVLGGAIAVTSLCVAMGEVCNVSEDASKVAVMVLFVGALGVIGLLVVAGKTFRRAFHETRHRHA